MGKRMLHIMHFYPLQYAFRQDEANVFNHKWEAYIYI